MRLKKLLVPAMAALLLGLIQSYFLIFCWIFIAHYSPLPKWLFELGLRQSIQAALLPIDFLTSVALSLPIAYVISKLKPDKLWLYLILAIIPSFIWINRYLVGDSYFIENPIPFILGWIPELFSLPCAVWIVHSISNRLSPN